MTTDPLTPEDRRQAIIEEARRMERWANVYTESYRRDAISWRRINTWLVVTSALLAAVAAGTGLSSLTSKTVAGLIALAAAATSGVATALGASNRASQNQITSAADSALSDDTRKFIATDAPFISVPDVVAQWETLCKKRDSIVANAPISRLLWRGRPTLNDLGHQRKS